MTALAVAVLMVGLVLLVLSERRAATPAKRRELTVAGALVTLLGLTLAVGVMSGW